LFGLEGTLCIMNDILKPQLSDTGRPDGVLDGIAGDTWQAYNADFT